MAATRARLDELTPLFEITEPIHYGIERIFPDEYEFGELLGEGAHSKVYKAVHRVSKDEVAIKVI